LAVIHRASSSMATSRDHIPYRPALDGIRALAVGAVLAYHAGMPWAKGGFLGVDAFFVLSGFLITSLLLTEWRSRESIDLLAFWSRRARRLLPALFLMLGGVALYALFIAQPDELNKLRADALATIGYVANWRPVFAGQSYFDQFSVPSPLRHTWSLAIEEQYYLVWPLLLLLLMKIKRGSLGVLLTASLTLLAGSALLMAVLFQPGHDPSRVYYGTDTRAQSLLAGAVLAMLLLRFGPVRGRVPTVALQVAAVACVVFLARAWWSTSSGSTLLFRGGFLMLAAGVAVVITAAVQPEGGLVGRVLSVPPLRWLGLISYGVYLWHWPLYLILTPDRMHIDGYALFAVRVAATLGVATASYHIIEMPVRRGLFRRWRLSWTLAPTFACVAAAAVVLVTRGGSPAFSLSSVAAAPMPSVTASPDLPASAGLLRVLLFGDSVGLTLGLGLQDEESALNMVVWDKGSIGCGLFNVDEEVNDVGEWYSARADMCKEVRSEWVSQVQSFQPDVVMLLVGPWDSTDLNVSGKILELGSSEWHDYAWSQLDAAVHTFSSTGAKVILLTAPCFKPRDSAIVAPIDGQHLTEWPVDPLNDLYREYAAKTGNASIIDLQSYVCPAGQYTDLTIDGVKIRYDGVHFSEDGAAVVSRWLAPQIDAIAGRDTAVAALTGSSGG
jgi:peptidoglycan/LPS O-acetylase OafA/YrhL